MANLEIDSKNLKLVVQYPAVGSIVKFINVFTKLYIGKIQPAAFKKAFREIKLTLLSNVLKNSYVAEDLGHKIDLCHQALNYSWHSPGTATVIDGELWWESGQSRILAGGLCQSCDQQQVLLVASDIKSAEQFMVDPTEITSDSELMTKLGIESDEKCMLDVRLDSATTQSIFLKLGAIKRSVSGHSYLIDPADRVDTLLQWMQQHPIGSRVDVYTDYPEKIIDSIGYWSVNHVGPSVTFEKKSDIDFYLYNKENQTPTPCLATHEFYVQDSCDMVDLSELLFWADLEFDNLYTNDFRYCLHKKSIRHTAKFIGLSSMN